MLDDIHYKDFVYNISSPVTKDSIVNLKERLSNLEEQCRSLDEFPRETNFVPHLLTAALGLSGESGEFNDHVKKLIFHNKELTEERRDAMIKELGDVMWYVMQACIALDVDLYKVVGLNEEKLRARHSGDVFTENYSSDSEK